MLLLASFLFLYLYESVFIIKIIYKFYQLCYNISVFNKWKELINMTIIEATKPTTTLTDKETSYVYSLETHS